MKITIRLFAQLKDLIQEPELLLESEGAISCREAAGSLGRHYPGVIPILKQCVFAHNGVLTSADALLEDGDELALLPPVSGG